MRCRNMMLSRWHFSYIYLGQDVSGRRSGFGGSKNGPAGSSVCNPLNRYVLTLDVGTENP